MASKDNSALDYTDAADVRSLWEHEDRLINHRMTWLGMTQGLLFAAYGVLVSKSGEIDPNFEKLIKLISDVGFYTSALIFTGILAAIFAMLVIKHRFKQEQLGITPITTFMGFVCAAGLPIIFMFAWSSLG